jgi:PAS domain S-box-containing protein
MKVSNSDFHILIVDDTPKNLQLLMSILSKEQYEIYAAQNGTEALEKAHTITPDLILLDVMMPEMDGFETCKELKSSKDTEDIPVIFLTARTDPEDIVTGFEKGGVDYLTKPFNSAELLARVHTQLELRSKENEIRKLSQATEQSPASVVITDLEGRIEYVNPKFSSLTGYSFAEALGQNPRILKTDEKSPEEYKELWDTITSGNEWKGVFHNKKKNGELYWESATIAPIKNDKGEFSHFLAIKEDITEQKIADQKLQESYQTIKAQKEQLIEELEQARTTQLSLLPLTLPDIPNARVAAKYVPMEEVGGDFYDVFELEPNVYGLLVADVTGHGVSAALLSFMFYSMFTNARNSGRSPQLTVSLTNEYLEDKVEEGKFATMFYAVYNSSTRQLTYTGAGHPSGFLIRPSTDEIIELDTEGMLIGFFSPENASFEEKTIQLQPKDKVLLYTDGIIEVLDKQEEIFGSERLKELLLQHKHTHIEELLDQIYEFGNEFSEYSGFGDDITMLGLEVT